MALKPGICQLCMAPSQLAKSHAIPNALIRDIKGRNSGQTTVISGRPPRFRWPNESGEDHLLCELCEGTLSTSFDSYGVSWINLARQQLDNSPREDRLEVDPQRMLGFVSAVLWRAAISTNALYDSIETEYGDRMQLRRVFDAPDDRYAFATMSVSNLIDSKKRFSTKPLRDVIVPPTSWRAMSAGRRLLSFFFIANGLFFGFVMPPPSRGTGKGTLWTADTFRPRIRDQDIRSFAPLRWMLALPINRSTSNSGN